MEVKKYLVCDRVTTNGANTVLNYTEGGVQKTKTILTSKIFLNQTLVRDEPRDDQVLIGWLDVAVPV